MKAWGGGRNSLPKWRKENDGGRDKERRRIQGEGGGRRGSRTAVRVRILMKDNNGCSDMATS